MVEAIDSFFRIFFSIVLVIGGIIIWVKIEKWVRSGCGFNIIVDGFSNFEFGRDDDDVRVSDFLHSGSFGDCDGD